MMKKNLPPKPADKEAPAEGMPSIAKSQQKGDKTLIKAICIVAISIAILALIWIKKHETAAQKPTGQTATEEDYNVPEATAEQQKTTAAKPPASKQNTVAVSKELNDEQKQMLLALEKERQARLQAPVMLVGKSENSSDSAAKKQKSVSDDPNTQFLEQLSGQDGDTLQASTMGNRSKILAEGTLIHGIMESAINSDLPGMVRAIVSEPVYAEDASQVLIQPGSRLIGQYKSGMQQGQTRIFVVWTTLIQPTGSRIKLSSPGVDNLGIAGAGADAIDYHFWERFGTSGLLSIIGAGAANVGVNSRDQFNASQAYRQAVAQSFSESAKDAYKQNGAIPPTLHINQGQAIMVFVAHTLDFSHVVKDTRQKVGVF